MTPIEAAETARELASHLQWLAEHEQYRTSLAVGIDARECLVRDCVDALAGFAVAL